MKNKFEVLKNYFGYDSFRKGQEAVVDAVLRGQDALGIMPTGAGKSLCFQVPAILFEGITLVVSPLLSLMKDQVMTLIEAGVPAAYFNSSLNERQYIKALDNARQGRYKIIYVAPERLLTQRFQAFVQQVDITMVVVDEAHCVSQWGQDFRPSYLDIAPFFKMLKKRPVVSAYTATATEAVQKDIIQLIGLKEPEIVATGFDRENLYFKVMKDIKKREVLLDIVENHRGQSGIIYCTTRKNVEEVCQYLENYGIDATRYHAGLPQEERSRNQEDFLYDRKDIMVATNAFGMGIDKSDVRFVVHYNMPKDLESYYQEAGRAGRDGLEAECILLYGGRDLTIAKFLINNRRDTADLDENEVAKLIQMDMNKLEVMVEYVKTSQCLRGYILKYFGETPEKECGNCYNCLIAEHSLVRSIFKENLDEGLYFKLKETRLLLARQKGVPAFVIFSDKTLKDMCRKMPVTREAFLEITGVGVQKTGEYSEAFMEVIKEHLSRNESV